MELFSLRGIRSVSVYGGVSRRPQEDKLAYGVEICVATPGRLNDLLRSGSTNLNRCTFLVRRLQNFLNCCNKAHIVTYNDYEVVVTDVQVKYTFSMFKFVIRIQPNLSFSYTVTSGT